MSGDRCADVHLATLAGQLAVRPIRRTVIWTFAGSVNTASFAGTYIELVQTSAVPTLI